jgi:alpha-beta hydrolase superfamily lysophospholipase
MPHPEPTSTYLELRQSTESGEASAGLSHTPGGLFLLHVVELAAYGEPKGGITLVHDAGDHGGRYLGAARVLAAGGYAVALPDLRGHGKSEGARGHSAGAREVVRDLEAVQEHLAYRLPVAPKVLVGQGLGALYALAFAIERPGQIAGLVLLAPRLRPSFRLPQPKKGLFKMFQRVSPESAGAIGVEASALSSDPAEQAAWGADPLVHDAITLGAAEAAAEMARSYPPRLQGAGVPVLVLHGGGDAIAAPEHSQALAQHGAEVRILPGLRHDLLHEVGAEGLAGEILAWVDAQVSRHPLADSRP